MRIGSGAILASIKKRWQSMRLDTVITGGLHLGTAPKTTQMPYCVLNVVSEVVEARTSSGDYNHTEYTRLLLDFVVFAAGGLQVASDLADLVREKFDNAPLMLQTGEGSVLQFRWVSSVPLQDPQIPSVWSCTVTYDVMRERKDVVN